MKIKLMLYCCILLICFGCKSYKTKYPYSLEDFRPELRENLQVLLNEGSLCENDSSASAYINKKTSKQDLLKIFKCEHPILRAMAFRALVYNNLIDSGKLLLQNLNDEAKIFYCDHYGEYYESVSDYCIFKSLNKTNIDKEELFSDVMKKNKNLTWFAKFAYFTKIKNAEYYKIIKDKFLTIENDFDENKIRLGIALASYQKYEDTSYLRELINLKPPYNLKSTERNFSSVTLIKEFPNECFLRIVEKYLTTFRFRQN
jgi:hypothetical protein